MAPQTPHAMLKPLWVRLLLVALCVGALIAEYLFVGDPLWLFMWAAVSIYAVYDLFLRGTYGKREPAEPEGGGDAS